MLYDNQNICKVTSQLSKCGQVLLTHKSERNICILWLPINDWDKYPFLLTEPWKHYLSPM